MSTPLQFEGTVEQIIDQMRAATGATSDADLARLLGLQRSAVAQWKKRGSVPAKAMGKADQIAFAITREGQAEAWLETMPQDIRAYAKALAIKCASPTDYRAESAEAKRNLALRLYRKASLFEELAVACALKLDQLLQMQPRLTAQSAFISLLFDPYLEHDVSEKIAYGELAFLREPPDSEK